MCVRDAKNTPLYTNGAIMKRKGKRTSKHQNACRKFRDEFLKEHGYIHCESKYCEDANKAFPPHSAHHIQSAGRYPRHEHLHNPLNLILLCHTCHTEFEENKRLDEYNELVEERGLNKLFRGV
jgi:hypothetical protein